VNVEQLGLAGVLLVRPTRFHDSRGYFVETWNQDAWRRAGIPETFVQENSSLSLKAGTIRGLHFQKPPMAQAKLVRVVRGAIFDVVVDVNPDSPGFGRRLAVTLTSEGGEQLFIPAGFAHGFCTLAPNTEITYKVTAPYSKPHEAGIRWNDPGLDIEWPLAGMQPTLSEKDMGLPLLSETIASPRRQPERAGSRVGV
jgi:dTDP-4-dehydrorhamnose 3,5-epimerase